MNILIKLRKLRQVEPLYVAAIQMVKGAWKMWHLKKNSGPVILNENIYFSLCYYY